MDRNITKPYVCIDIDGTILDLCKGMEKYLKEKGVTFFPENMSEYDFGGDIGCPKEVCFQAFQDPKFWKTETEFPISDLKSVGNMLKDEGYNPYVYTLLNYGEDVRRVREKYLKSSGIEEYCIFNGEKPVFVNASALFEDYLENIRRWIDAGFEGKVYLVNQPYNQEYNHKDFPYFDRVERVDSVEKGVELFLEEMRTIENEKELP